MLRLCWAAAAAAALSALLCVKDAHVRTVHDGRVHTAHTQQQVRAVQNKTVKYNTVQVSLYCTVMSAFASALETSTFAFI